MAKFDERKDTGKPGKTGKNGGCCDGGKKRADQGKTTRGRGVKIIALSGLVLLAGLAAMASAGWFGGLFRSSPAQNAKASGVVDTLDAVKIPLEALDSGKALFLEADLGGRQIYYFALKSSDGVYRAAYDTCDVCFRSNRGYRQEGDLMVCNNCGQKFPSAKVNEVKGGCNPAPLARRVDGDSLVILKSDIAAGADFFVRKRS